VWLRPGSWIPAGLGASSLEGGAWSVAGHLSPLTEKQLGLLGAGDRVCVCGGGEQPVGPRPLSGEHQGPAGIGGGVQAPGPCLAGGRTQAFTQAAAAGPIPARGRTRTAFPDPRFLQPAPLRPSGSRPPPAPFGPGLAAAATSLRSAASPSPGIGAAR
jgi:hypothetical protein